MVSSDPILTLGDSRALQAPRPGLKWLRCRDSLRAIKGLSESPESKRSESDLKGSATINMALRPGIVLAPAT
jgi:hypothetical protein